MGVLMWEAYSGGKIPWSKTERDDDVIQRVINGDRLSQPSNCSSQYWSVIVKTWSKSPHDRPTFRELKRLLTEQYYQKVQPLLPLLSNIHLDDGCTQDGITIAGRTSESGNELDELAQPHGLYVTDDQTIYIADYHNHRIMEWVFGESSGRVVARGSRALENNDQIGYPTDVMDWLKGAKAGIVVAGGRGEGNDVTQLRNPQQMVVDQSGIVYVADCGNHRIMCWFQGADKGRVVVGGNGKGNEANQFNSPTGLAIDLQGNLYVADTLNHRVQKFFINTLR
ncbi:unnamed protein product [Adineta steineri]|uniref:Protein kinase domain-containing protein n=1 Tax=Adineta steineri TaxID=433720 RepID=A0A814G2P8_9BILA|nr:unnamed protein product [Adineta steineri]CAF0992727.1 unnamed protein product [Adineta steineri]